MIARFNLLWGNYTEALDAANKVIALNQYELDPDFLNMFSMAGQNSKKLFVLMNMSKRLMLMVM